MIRVNQDSIPFTFRAIVGVNKPNELISPELMILDGQQRLTSLYYVFYSPNENLKGTKNPYKFYIDLEKLSKGDIDNSILSERADNANKMDDEEYQYNNFIIPISKLLEWDEWISRYALWLMENHGDKKFKEFYSKTKVSINPWIKNLLTFQIPIVFLPIINSQDEEDIGEICAIFEKINSTGITLTVFDLLTARLFKYNIDLFDMWQKTLEKHSNIKILANGSDAKGKSIVNIKPENFELDWVKATKYFDKAIQRVMSVKGGYGAFESKWIPYSSMIPVLAALIWKIEEQDDKLDNYYQLLNKWYWSSVFLERYSGSTESISYMDYKELITKIENPDATVEVFNDAESDILDNSNYSIIRTSRKNSIYRAIMNLLAKNGALDFRSADSIEFHELDDHHIFPSNYLEN